MRFPDKLPENLRKRLPAGVSLFPRPEKKRWVFAYEAKGGGRPQKVVPKEIVEPAAAFEYMITFLRAQGIDPGANLDRRKVEGPTVGACGERWLKACEQNVKVAPATLAGYRYHFTKHIAPRFGDVAIVALAVPMLRTWIREDFASVAPRTVHHAVSAFAVLVDHAIAEGWISVDGDDWTKRAVNPLRSPAVRDVLPDPDDPEPMKLPLAWVQTLIDSPKVPLERRTRYAIAFCHGLRDGEIAGIQLSRIRRDVPPPTLEIAVSVATVGSKVDGETSWAKPKAPKTKGSKRTIPVHRAADAAIEEWIADGLPKLVGRSPGPDDYLFPRPDGKPARPRSAELLRDDLKAVGLPEVLDGRPVDFKAARSSFGTWLDEAGVERLVRKRLMGHVITDVTERHYTKRELERLAESINKIDLAWPTGTLPAVVPDGTVSAAKSAESLSHLRDLNSRPTVYEGGGHSAPMVPVALVDPTNGTIAADLSNGQRTRNGPKKAGRRGAKGRFVVPNGRRSGSDRGASLPTELAQARDGLRALRSGWDSLEAAIDLDRDAERGDEQ